MVASASSRRTRDGRIKLQLLVISNGPPKGRIRSACRAIVAVRKPRGLAGWTLEGGRGQTTISLFVTSLRSEAHVLIALTKSTNIHLDEKSSKRVKKARKPDSTAVSNM